MLAPYRQKVIEYTSVLTVWQKLYFFAFFIVLFEFIFATGSADLSFAGLIALAALSIELWPKFVHLWESILGRVLVLATYIIVTNFAIAAASHQLNQIVGIDPSNLFYATGFVSVLMAPVWIVGITLIGMLLYVIAKYVWFLVTLVPWLIGLYEKRANKVEHLAKTTRVAKILLVPVMFMALVSVLELYSDSDVDILTDSVDSFEENTAAAEADKATTTKQALTEAGQANTQNDFDDKATQIKDISINGMSVNSWVKGNDMNRLIATFVYYVEGFKYSQCEKTEQERLVSIGEYDVLAIAPDDSQLGYQFTVRPCQLKSYPVK